MTAASIASAAAGDPHHEVERIGTDATGTKSSPRLLDPRGARLQLQYLGASVSSPSSTRSGHHDTDTRGEGQSAVPERGHPTSSATSTVQRTLIDPDLHRGEKDAIKVEIALQYNDKYDEKILTVNNINTREGDPPHRIPYRQAGSSTSSCRENPKLLKKYDEARAGDI